MRIVAGRHRGRRLLAPPGEGVRPTSERAREALFNILEHGDVPVRDAAFLDLFAGTGAVGLEAASRGAARVLLVEHDRAAVAAARANIEKLGEAQRVRLLSGDATRLGFARERFDLVYLDPPYRSGLAAVALDAVRAGGWLEPHARLVVEAAAREPLEIPSGFRIEDERRYGAGRLIFLRLGDGSADGRGVDRALSRA